MRGATLTATLLIGIALGGGAGLALCRATEMNTERRLEETKALAESYRLERDEEKNDRLATMVRLNEMNRIVMHQRIHWWLIPASGVDDFEERIPKQEIPVPMQMPPGPFAPLQKGD